MGKALGGPPMIGPTSLAWCGMTFGTADSKLWACDRTIDDDLKMEVGKTQTPSAVFLLF